METKVTFKGILKNGIGCVAISNDCKRVAAISLEKNKCLVVYDMEKAYIIYFFFLKKKTILNILFTL